MNSIASKYISKTLVLILSAGTVYACSKSENGIEPGPGGGSNDSPVELSVALKTDPAMEETRGSENPNDYGQETKIYSLEVFIFKPSGELDGHKLITPATISIPTQVDGKYYDKEYKEITEITSVHLTAGQRQLYVIANPPFAAYGSSTESEIYAALKLAAPTPETNTGSHTAFRALYADLNDQGYIVSPGNRFPNPDGTPIGGQDPTGLQTALTMTGNENIAFSNQHTKHYLGYGGTHGTPGDVAPAANEKVIRAGFFYVDRLVARVMLQKVTLPMPATAQLEFETGYPTTKYSATLDSVFMLNVQGHAKLRDDNPALTGQYYHGTNHIHKFFSDRTAAGLSLAATSSLFNPAAPKTKLVEDIVANSYDVDAHSSSPIWFYAFENQAVTATYLVVGVRYNFESAKDGGMKTAKSYYPIAVNVDGTITPSPGHTGIKKNWQYKIAADIKKLGLTYDPAKDVGPLIRSVQEINWNDVMTVEQEAGKYLFPWTGNKI